MSPGQTGHITGQMGRVPGTDGTHTRGCPAKILYVYWFFSFPNMDQGVAEKNWQNALQLVRVRRFNFPGMSAKFAMITNIIPPQDVLVVLLPLACPLFFLQGNQPRNPLCTM